METIPRDMVNAARVDGASEFRILFQIIFPLLQPAIATVALFCFIWSWNEFLYALVYVQKPELRTISVGLALLESVPNFPRQINIIMAAATSLLKPEINWRFKLIMKVLLLRVKRKCLLLLKMSLSRRKH